MGALKGRVRRIAVIALARKLLVALWRYVETGLVPDGAVLKADKKMLKDCRRVRSGSNPGIENP